MISRAPSILSAALLVLGACGGAAGTVTASPIPTPTSTPARTAATPPSSAPTATSAAAAAAANTSAYLFVADLKSANEVPAIADAEASCTGKGTFTLETTQDSYGYYVETAVAKFNVVVSGCPASTTIILSHIHQGTAGTNGAVKIDSGLLATAPIALTAGGTTIARSGITVDPSLAQDVIDNPGGFYLNVHSALHQGGVIRGQLTKG